MKEKDEINLDNINLDEDKEIDSLSKEIDDNLDIDNLIPTEVVTNPESNDILDNADKLTLGLTDDQIKEFYEYLAGKRPRPEFAEKFFADAENRVRESNQLTTLMSLSFVPKLLAMQQSLINDLSNPVNMKFQSNEEKISYLQTLAVLSVKFNEAAMKYTQISKDFTGVPLIYRQLLDQLLQISSDKLPRLKMIPQLVDLDEDTWNRIVEIAKLK